MADFGGEMRFTYGGQGLVLRSKFDHEPVSFEADGGANQDGSVFRTLKPTGTMAEPTFENTLPPGVTWDQTMRGGPYNMTLTETQMRQLHTWTGAQFEGKPRVDEHTGEVTGIKIRCPNGGYSKRAI